MKPPVKKQQQLKHRPSAKKQPEVTTRSFFQQSTDFFERNRRLFFVLSMIAGVLMSILMFDVKVSLSGDDSDYIVYADEFLRHFTFPGFRGPLYPVILAPFIGLFGMNLIVLKSLSAIFILLSVWFLYKSFQDIIPAVVLMPAIFLACICSYLFFYATYTYSEPLFMFVQSLFIFFFAKYFIKAEQTLSNLKLDWHKYLILGGLALCMGLTRSIGYSVIGVVMLYFIIQKRWKDMAYTLAASILIFCLFQVFKTVVWPDAGSAYDIKNYLAKDYYNPVEMESLTGFFYRLLANSSVYLSALLCQFMGVIPETPSNILQIDTTRTILIYLIFFICLFIVFKRNNALLFAGFYVGVMNFFSFVILQASWAQDRLIVIYYPLILVFLLGGVYYLFQIKAIRTFFFVYPLIILILCFGTLSITTDRIGRNFPVLQQNVFGNQLSGLTPDWQNFIRASQWASQNLDKDAVIVSRKPSISRVYTGRSFVWAPPELTVPLETLSMMQNTGDQSVIVVFGLLQYPDTKYVISYLRPFQFKEKTMQNAQVCLIPNTELETFIESLQQQQMGYTLDYVSYLEGVRNVDYRIYDPDILLNALIESDIRYLLLAQLRVDPLRNTGVYINNIHRYIWNISSKYPNRFRSVYIEGTEETCEIIEFIR